MIVACKQYAFHYLFLPETRLLGVYLLIILIPKNSKHCGMEGLYYKKKYEDGLEKDHKESVECSTIGVELREIEQC